MKKKDLHITIWWLLQPLLIYYLVNNGIVMAGAWLLQKFMQAQQADSSHILQYLQTVVKMTGMFLAGVAVVPFYLCESAKEKEENKQPLHKKDIAGMIILGAVLGLGLNYLFAILGFTESGENYRQVAQAQLGLPLWLGIVFYGILSPVVEELVFRGIVFRFLKRQMETLAAVIGTALLFGGFHGNIVQMIYGSLMGIVLAICYEKYGKLGAPVLVHSAANIAVYTVLTFIG